MKYDTHIRFLSHFYALPEDEKRQYMETLAEEIQDASRPELKDRWGIFKNCKGKTNRQLEEMAEALLSCMTLQQKINQMTPNLTPRESKWFYKRYNETPYIAGQDCELDIPGLRFTDGPAGIVMGYESTLFPSAIARGASFDPDLEMEIADAIGKEGYALGANLFGGVCLNLIRHPAWGRSQESYGEDPYLLSVMGEAAVRGIQKHMMACIKHFAANSMENARFKINVQADERTLREVYLPHFQKCVQNGHAAVVMSAYNKVNGEYCGHNRHLLREILKEEWNFDGIVISDFIWGVRDTIEAVQGGLDIEMHVKQYFGEYLEKEVTAGNISRSMIDDSVRRILKKKMEFARRDLEAPPEIHAFNQKEHEDLAQRAAEESFVLLKNEESFLPLSANKIKKLVLVGELALRSNPGDSKGSAAVYPPYTISPLDGIRQYLGKQAEVVTISGECPGEVSHHCKDADAVIVFAGLTCKDEGEYLYRDGVIGGDRKRLSLRFEEEEMIRQVCRINPRTLVCLEGGSALLTENWQQDAAAILMLWYPGMRGGNALAEIVFGEKNPSGKMPITVCRSEQDYPYFDRDAEEIHYSMFHGYFKADRDQTKPRYSFGYGLSYTTFAVSEVKPHVVGKSLFVSCRIENTGLRDGAEVIQLYTGYLGSKVIRHSKDLRAFRKVFLTAGQTKQIELHLECADLAYYDCDTGKFVEEDIVYEGFLGTSSKEEDLIKFSFSF